MDEQLRETEQDTKGGNGLGILALMVALAAAGGAFYLHQQQQQAFAALQERHQSLQQSLEALPLSLEDWQKQMSRRLDELPAPLALETVQEQIQSRLQQSESALRGELEQAILDYARGEVPRVDLSQEIARMDEIRAAQAAIAEEISRLNGQSEAQRSELMQFVQQKEQALQQQNQDLMQQASAHIQQELQKLDVEIQERIDPRPTLHWLTLADLSARYGGFAAAQRYAQQAEESASAFKNQSELQQALRHLSEEYQQLAQQTPPEWHVQALLDGVEQWPFRGQEALPAAEMEESGWWNGLKRFAARSSSIQVVKSDDRALAWINKHQDLQEILRQNVRLDLSFARNALQLGDAEAYAQIVQRLQTEVPRYFDVQQPAVAEALQQLQDLQLRRAPDVQALQQRLQNLR